MNIFQEIKALFAVKSTVTEIIKGAKTMTGSKPGYLTSEFYFNVAGQLGVLWGAVHGFIPQPWASVISISGIAIYTIARTVVKAISDVKTARLSVGEPVVATATVTTGK